jgi:hypothetical protein
VSCDGFHRYSILIPAVLQHSLRFSGNCQILGESGILACRPRFSHSHTHLGQILAILSGGRPQSNILPAQMSLPDQRVDINLSDELVNGYSTKEDGRRVESGVNNVKELKGNVPGAAEIA